MRQDIDSNTFQVFLENVSLRFSFRSDTVVEWNCFEFTRIFHVASFIIFILVVVQHPGFLWFPCSFFLSKESLGPNFPPSDSNGSGSSKGSYSHPSHVFLCCDERWKKLGFMMTQATKKHVEVPKMCRIPEDFFLNCIRKALLSMETDGTTWAGLTRVSQLKRIRRERYSVHVWPRWWGHGNSSFQFFNA